MTSKNKLYAWAVWTVLGSKPLSQTQKCWKKNQKCQRSLISLRVAEQYSVYGSEFYTCLFLATIRQLYNAFCLRSAGDHILYLLTHFRPHIPFIFIILYSKLFVLHEICDNEFDFLVLLLIFGRVELVDTFQLHGRVKKKL